MVTSKLSRPDLLKKQWTIQFSSIFRNRFTIIMNMHHLCFMWMEIKIQFCFHPLVISTAIRTKIIAAKLLCKCQERMLIKISEKSLSNQSFPWKTRWLALESEEIIECVRNRNWIIYNLTYYEKGEKKQRERLLFFFHL